MKNWIVETALIFASLAWPMASVAEDIDLFMGPTTLASAGAPNVLFVVDNTGNWSGPFDEEKAAFQSVFNTIKARILDEEDDFAVNVGLMMFSETGSDDSNVSGAYVRAAVRPMGDKVGSDTYAELYSDLIGGLNVQDDRASAGYAGWAMAEAYRYFAGQAPYAGNNKAKTDWGQNDVTGIYNQHYNHSNPNKASCCAESHPIWALPGNALDTKGSSLYNSPVTPGSCGKNYIIWISNGPTQDPKKGGSTNPIAKQLLDDAIAALGSGDNTQIPLSPSGSEATWADEWARFMYKSPEAVTVFSVDVLPSDKGQGPGWSRLLKSMADESNGVAYTVSDSDAVAAGLIAAINDAIDRILAVNTVFASVALPASSNAQSTFLNQVFIGQFRPDKDAHPRWPGNLKQYRLAVVGSQLKMVDADGDAIIDPGTGFIEKCAKSYWSSADSYWSGALALDLEGPQICTENSSDSTTSNSPDGPLVEKGAQAQHLRSISPASRSVYTCNPDFTLCTSRTNFNTLNDYITADSLNVDAAIVDETINWARGADIDNEDGDEDNNPATVMRASAHGDVVHSRPVAVNYGTDAAPQVVVFYSGNDGMLRAINGNRPDVTGIVNTLSGTTPGKEIWAFMPPEFYPYIDVLRQNSALINFPASASGAPTSGISKPYGIDGPLMAFDGNVPEVGDKKYLYAGMRRAGRALYAFDVTTVTSPQLLWKKGCAGFAEDDDCTGGWEDIGQTWSQPNLLYANGYRSGANDLKPMLIMGGGYDNCEDTDNNDDINHSCSGDFTGNVIYLLDAHTGSIEQTFPTDRPVAGGITVVPYGEDPDSGIMYAYASDTGGNIYRISGGEESDIDAIGTTEPGDWIITKIASLGCDDLESCTLNRKFLFGPDVVRDTEIPGQFAVVLGSGDREKPLTDYGAAANVENYFFSVFDRPLDADWLNDETYSAICGTAIVCKDALTEVSIAGLGDGDTMSPKGWLLPLAPGEQVVTGTITVTDVANFSTHIPAQPTDVCVSNLGTAYSYNLDFRGETEGDKTEIVGGGLVPTPVAGMVTIDGVDYPFCIGCGGEESAIGAKLVGTGITWTQPKSRVYWNIQQ